MQRVPKLVRKVVLVGVLLFLTLMASFAAGIIVKNGSPAVLAQSKNTRAKYTLWVSLDGVLPSMITPQDAPFITSLAHTGVHFTDATAPVPGDSITAWTSDLAGAFPTQTGLVYETIYDRHYNQVIELDETPILPPGFTLQNAGNLVNAETIFQAAKAAGLRTEFDTKYPAYSIENGPARFGPSPSIDVLRTSTFANFPGTPQQYDDIYFSNIRSDVLSGPNRPNLYVLYAVSPNSIEKEFGINAPQVAQVISFEDNEIKQTVDAFKQAGIYNQTDIVVTSDHGNTAVNTAIPGSGPGSIQQYLDDHGIPVAQSTTDQVDLIWLQNPAQTQAAINLLSPKAVRAQFGIWYFLTQADLRRMHAAPPDRTPDFAIEPTIGENGTPAVVYTSPPLGKHVEHGGFNASDLNVPLFISGPGIKHGVTSDDHVFDMQIAPTLAHTMCLDLKTAVLPPLQQAMTGPVDCGKDNASRQNSIQLTALPFTVPLFGLLLVAPWFVRRRAKSSYPQG